MSSEKKIDRLYVDKKTIDQFNRLKDKDSPFAGCQNKEIFFAAMTLGYNNKIKIPFDKRKEFVREEYLNDEDHTIIKSIAVAETGNLKILLDKKKVYAIAEQYATGGISLLFQSVFGNEYGSYTKKLESKLLQEYCKLKEQLPKKPIFPEDLEELSIDELIEKGENEVIEFKSSLIWDCKQRRPSREMKKEVATSISSFMNSNGGFLLIGVEDNGGVMGIVNDLLQCHNSKDELERTLTSAVNTYLGKVNRIYLKHTIEKVNDKEIILARVIPSPHPVYFNCKGEKEKFFIRSGNSTQELEISEYTLYIKEHWPNL
ncbi:MAG: RNA-binding domain-containing protein [archaeon]